MESHLEKGVGIFGANVQRLRLLVTNPDLIFGLSAGSLPNLKVLMAYYPHLTVSRFKALLAAAPSLQAIAFRGGMDFAKLGAILSLLLDRSKDLMSIAFIRRETETRWSSIHGPSPESRESDETNALNPTSDSSSVSTIKPSDTTTPSILAPSLTYLQLTIPYSTRSQLDFDGPEILSAVLYYRPSLRIEIVANSSSLHDAAAAYESVMIQFPERLRVRAAGPPDVEMRLTVDRLKGDGPYGW